MDRGSPNTVKFKSLHLAKYTPNVRLGSCSADLNEDAWRSDLDFGLPSISDLLPQQVPTGCCSTDSTSYQVSKFKLGILGIGKGQKVYSSVCGHSWFSQIHFSMHVTTGVQPNPAWNAFILTQAR